MIVVMRPDATPQQIDTVVERLRVQHVKAHLSTGEERTIIGGIGDVRNIDHQAIEAMEGVDRVVSVQHPFKLASREFHPHDTLVEAGGVLFGGRDVPIIAGPCSVEGEDTLLATAAAVRQAGAAALRGGAFKPRTSPYSFQGLGLEGLRLLAEARRATGLPVVTEVMSPEMVEQVADYADMLQIGARSMQNYPLLQEVGRSGRPVMLKRGLSATIEEWLLSAEHILAQGNPDVILCERGIRTFETETRNTLDLNAVPVVKRLSHLPVVVDPSHGTGHWHLVRPMARAAVAAGADGLIIEVHPDPAHALSDGAQSLKMQEFQQLVQEVAAIAEAMGRAVAPAPSLRQPMRGPAGRPRTTSRGR